MAVSACQREAPDVDASCTHLDGSSGTCLCIALRIYRRRAQILPVPRDHGLHLVRDYLSARETGRPLSLKRLHQECQSF